MQSKYNNCGIQYVTTKSYKDLEKELAKAIETIAKLQIENKKQAKLLEDHSIDRANYMRELVHVRARLKTVEHRLYLATYEDQMGKR